MIPVTLVCAWVVLLYIAWNVSNLLLDQSPVPSSYSTGHIFFSAAVTALLVTTFDLNADPFAVANSWWVWIDGGPYFGVPIHNFVGWFIIAFVTFLLHGYQMKKEKVPTLDGARSGARKWSIAPLLVYIFAGIIFVLINFDHKLGLITVYLILLPSLYALWNWGKWYQKTAQA